MITPHTYLPMILLALLKLWKMLQILFLSGLKDNQMQGNAGKYHILLSTKEKVVTKDDSADIENSQSEK